MIALAGASPSVRVWRRAGYSWDHLSRFKACNPLELSARQLQRIYDGPSAYNFDALRRIASKLDREPAKPKPAE